MATDVGSAVGYLDLDISGFLSGLQTAQSEGKKVENKFKVVGDKMQSVGDKMSKIGGTMTKTFTIPVVTAVTAVVNQYAKLEQAVGGVETLFKDSADAVITNSETAYMRAGVSGVEYMEQVTSFSARLLQGLGGDTVEAARVADMAMVDMADNANKFGTDIGSIQNAYQGFAKANFTMLDNLKLGYGGTAGEMARLINESGVLGDTMVATADNVKDIPFDAMIRAINITQQRMGVFGTTSLEATETVSGSFGALKASVLDFAAGMGDANADVNRLTQNMISTFKTFASNVVRVLKNIWDNLPLSDTQKKLIAIAAATGPIVLGLGKVVAVGGKIVTAIGAIKGAFTLLAANPVMIWILGGALAVGAIAGIVTAITNATSEAKKLKDKLANMDMTISEESKAAIGRGIEAGIEIANKTFEIELAVKAEVEEVTQKVHATFGQIVADAKGRFGATEMQELKTAVNTYVGGAIDQIKTTVGARAGEVAAEMDRLGVDEATKQAAVDAVKAQGDTAIADLQTYEASAIAILESIAANGGKATRAQEKEFNDLIGKIKDIGTEWNAVDTESMIAKLEGAYDAITAIPKTKLSSKELNELKSSVKTFVGGAIDEVKSTVDAKASEVASAMDAIGMSDAVKEEAVAGVTSRGDTMVADLQEYERQALLLLEEMGKAGENVTQDQITAFENLMLQIGAIKTEIGLMANDMDGKIEALRNKVTRGLATEEEIATVVNYDLQMGVLRTEQAQADYDADLEQFGVALQHSTEANKPEIEMQLDLRTEQFNAEVAAAQNDTTASVSALWESLMASNESGSAAMASSAEAANVYASMVQMFEMPEGFDSLDDEAKAQMTEMILNAVPELTAEQINAPMAPIAIYAMEAMDAINASITDGAAEIESNESLRQALNVMLESGALDNVDLTTLPDTLKGALTALNFAEGGGEIGEDVMSGLGLGFATGEGEAQSELETAAQSIIDAAKAKFGIQSPSTVFDEMGQQNMAGLSQGHQTGMDTVQSELESAAEAMWTSVEQTFVTAVEQIVEAVDAAFATMPEKLEVHTAAVEANLTAWGDTMSTSGQTVAEEYVLSFETAFGSLADTVDEATGSVTTKVTDWGNDLSTKGDSVAQDFVLKIETTVTTLPDKFDVPLTSIVTNVTTWGTNLTTKGQSTADDFVLKITTSINTLPDKVAMSTDKVLSNVTTWGTNMGAKATSIGDDFVLKLITPINTLPDKVASATDKTLSNVTTWGVNMGAKATSIGDTFVQNVNLPLSGMPLKLKAHTDLVISNMTSWGTQMGTAGTNAGRTLVDNTVAQTNGLPAKMQTAGSEAMAGFERGINSKMESIKSSVRAAVDAIVAEMKRALEVASPSKRIAREVGVFIPAGLAVGVQTAMPETIRDIQHSLDEGVDDLETPELQVATVSPMDSLNSFVNQLQQRYEQIAIWFESVEARVVQSIENMSAALGGFVQRTDIAFNGAGVLGAIPAGGYGPTIKYEVPVRQGGEYRDGGEGDTFNFYSPKNIDAVEAARLVKQTKRDMAEGF